MTAMFAPRFSAARSMRILCAFRAMLFSSHTAFHQSGEGLFMPHIMPYSAAACKLHEKQTDARAANAAPVFHTVIGCRRDRLDLAAARGPHVT